MKSPPRLIPYAAAAAVMVAAALLEHAQGRLWICACGRVDLWAGDIWSSDNSQHLFDPYTFTHILHGMAFLGVVTLLLPRLAVAWRFALAMLLESAWEVFENSQFIIDRYRQATLALGYTGDTVVNSLMDILACGVGFWIARRLGFRWSLVLFIAIEIVLLAWIRDGLILNIIMLIHPIDSIKAWQMGR